jgi:hypothetical protein
MTHMDRPVQSRRFGSIKIPKIIENIMFENGIDLKLISVIRERKPQFWETSGIETGETCQALVWITTLLEQNIHNLDIGR